MSTLPNRCLSSTTFVTEEVKITRPARADKGSAEAGEGRRSASGSKTLAWRFMTRTDWRRATKVTLRYIHGADPHVEVRARGHVMRYPWDVAVLDILADVCNRPEGRDWGHER